jgi:hypothetical protein
VGKSLSLPAIEISVLHTVDLAPGGMEKRSVAPAATYHEVNSVSACVHLSLGVTDPPRIERIERVRAHGLVTKAHVFGLICIMSQLASRTFL